MGLLSKIPQSGLFVDSIHPYFWPLTELVDELVRAIFKVLKDGEEEHIVAYEATGTYESVLAVLNRAFNNLPDVDPPLPSNPSPPLNPPLNPAPPLNLSPLSGLAPPSDPASSSKQKGEFKIPTLPTKPTHTSPRKPSTSDVPDPDKSLPDVNPDKSSNPSTPSKRKAKNLNMPPITPCKSPRNRNKSNCGVGGNGESSTFTYGTDSGYGEISFSQASSHAGFRYGAGGRPPFSSEEIDSEDGIWRFSSSSLNKRTNEQTTDSEETVKKSKCCRGF